MNNVWTFLAIIAACLFLAFQLQGGLWGQRIHTEDPQAILNHEMQNEFSQPNEWGYTIQWMFGPYLDPNSLTYQIGFLADLKGIRLTSTDDVEAIHAKIYKKNLKIMNSIRNIRPFLGEFPLTPDSFEVSIGFIDEKGNNLEPPYIVSLIMTTKNLEFNNYLPTRGIHPFETILLKPTRESIALQECYHPNAKRCRPTMVPRVPTYSSTPERYDNPSGEAMFRFAQKFGSGKGLYLAALGDAGGDFGLAFPFEIALWGHRQVNLKEARTLMTQLFNQFLQFLKTNKDVPERLIEERKLPRSTIDTDIPDGRHIALRLSFWDENIDRQPEPYIAEVRLYNQKIFYYTADENQVIKVIHEESIGEANALVESAKPKELADSALPS